MTTFVSWADTTRMTELHKLDDGAWFYYNKVLYIKLYNYPMEGVKVKRIHDGHVVGASSNAQVREVEVAEVIIRGYAP